MSKDLMIRSSAQEFITFKVQEKDKGIQVRYENENLWMTQKNIEIENILNKEVEIFSNLCVGCS